MTRNLFSKLIALISGIALVIVAYNHNNQSLYIIDGNAYGTTWSVTSTSYIGDHHKNNIISIINDIDYIASNYKADSEISLINQDNKTEYKISVDLFNILKVAKTVENKSDGFYNIMMARKSGELGFSPNFGSTDIQTSVSSYRLNDDSFILYKDSSNWFDLSSVAKGYAVQKIHEYLIINKLTNHLIDIGGEIIINGTNNNDAWKVGIQDPSSLINKSIKILSNKNSSFLAIATSGEYRNFKFDSFGRKISHSINPMTLQSINNEIYSVTVLHDNSAAYADAYATLFNVMGFEKAIDKASNLDIAVMFILDDGKMIFSKKWYDLQL